MADKKTTCCICGAEYEVCHFCPEVANFTPWRRICDTSKHYQIYLILSEYSSGVLNKADAVEQLKSIQVKPEDCRSFRPNIYRVIQEIFQGESIALDAVDAIENAADTNIDIAAEESSHYSVEMRKDSKPKYSKKAKNHKKRI